MMNVSIYKFQSSIIIAFLVALYTLLNILTYFVFVIIIHTDMIHENAPVTNAFVSVPADMGQLNCAAFIAGIIAGALESTKFVSIV